jgi:hypothetical protein
VLKQFSVGNKQKARTKKKKNYLTLEISTLLADKLLQAAAENLRESRQLFR